MLDGAFTEPRLSTPEGQLRVPDLVFTKDNTALVIDVMVRFEYAYDTLLRAQVEKVRYYRPYGTQIAALVGAKEVLFFGFPVGARGKWPNCNNCLLPSLGLIPARAKSFSSLVSQRALLYSLEVLRDFRRSIPKGQPVPSGPPDG